MTPQILGILNITSDSFSDGGRYLDPAAAIARGRQLMADGADILDIGPASSHPDASPVGAAEEIRRLAAVVPALQREGAVISIDSFEGETQGWAMAEGIPFLNDIHGFPDPALYPRLAASSARLIVMHAVQAEGIATRAESDAQTIWDRILSFFDARIEALTRAGIAAERLVLDPGMGFFLGRDPEVSFRVLAGIDRLKSRFSLPVLVSVSRKSFLRALTGRAVHEVAAATIAAELYAAERGVDYVRTHDVASLKDALKVRGALLRAAQGQGTR